MTSESLTSDSVKRVETAAVAAISAAASKKELDEARINYLGKNGVFTGLMKGLKDVDPSERKSIGGILNQAKTELEKLLDSRQAQLSSSEINQQLKKEAIDVTLPVKAPIISSHPGSLHPLTRVQRDLDGRGILAGV